MIQVRCRLFCLLAATASIPLTTGCAPVQQLQNVAAAGGALANSMTGTGEQLALTAGELRQLQTRDFGTTKAAAFASVMTVLLDSGYRVISADLESGLVTATASTTGRIRLDPTGLSRTSQTPLASVYVEEREAGTARVRIVFSVGSSATGQLASSGEKAILDRGIYDTFFFRLQEEVEQRPIARQPSTGPDDQTDPAAPSEATSSPSGDGPARGNADPGDAAEGEEQTPQG
jgi:hypothetical protein